MTKKITILIVDDNIDYALVLKDCIQKENDMEVAGIAEDGESALEQIYSLRPDFVLLDIVLPNLDGLGVLEKMAEQRSDIKPYFIMLTSLQQDKFIKKSVELGADYYLIKPVSVDCLLSHIRQIYNGRFNKNTPVSISNIAAPIPALLKPGTESDLKLERDVTSLMNQVGVPPHIVGFNYIREAIIRAVFDFRSVSPFKRVLYPEIAQKFGTNSTKVERSIKNAIKNVWSRNGSNSNEVLFGPIHINKSKPTNMEFIAVMADKIRVANQIKGNTNGRQIMK